jgi:hypothetical protein
MEAILIATCGVICGRNSICFSSGVEKLKALIEKKRKTND